MGFFFELTLLLFAGRALPVAAAVVVAVVVVAEVEPPSERGLKMNAVCVVG